MPLVKSEKRGNIYEVIEAIDRTARSEPLDWVQHYLAAHDIEDAESLRRAIQASRKPEGANPASERIQVPRETLSKRGDIEDCAAVALCLANALELPYEISVKGGTLFIFINGIEVLH